MLRLLYLFGDSVASTSEVYLSIVFFRMVVLILTCSARPKEIISSLVVLS
jgi:hypothetical protein